MKKVTIGLASDVPTGKLVKMDVADMNTSIVVARVGDGFCAVLNKCPHLGLPLAGGKLDAEQGTITCPFHNSRFNVCSGQNLDWTTGVLGVKLPAWSQKLVALGKQPAPVKAFKISEADGKLYADIE